MPNFWNITMDKEMAERFEKYRQELEKKRRKRITRTEFGRIVFEFWERTNQHYQEKLVNHKKEIEKHKDEIEKHKDEIETIEGLDLAS